MKPYKTGQGNWQLNYSFDGKQRTLSLGRGYTAGAADRTAKIVTELVALRKMGEPVPQDLLHRVGSLPVRIRAGLERGGLISCCFGISVGELIEKFLLDRKQLGVKPLTLSAYRNAFQYLLGHFSFDRSVSTISIGEVRALVTEQSQCQRKTTVSSMYRKYQALFQFAVKQGILSSSPFDFRVERVDTDESRWRYVAPGTILKVLNSCLSDYERLAIALGRFGGLRVPSELLSLRFRDIDGEVIRVADDTKTGFREVPLFPEIRVVFNRLTSNSDDFIFSGRSRSWFRKILERSIRRSGVQQWEKLWINLRSSFVTDLARMGYDERTMDSIVGNSAAVRRKHYVQFDKRRAYDRVLADAERIFSEDSGRTVAFQELLPLLREFLERS